jgi:geranylgeranyl diphosphate synthase type I
MPEDQVQSLLSRYRPLVDQALRRVLERPRAGELGHLLRYHLGFDPEGAASSSGGKRLRGLLCLLSAEAVGGETADASPAAAALELLHGFTLLHDDIADQDELRRGRPAVWKVWGVGQALTAGDAMFALANLALGDLHASTATLANVLLALNDATLRVCEGQHLDLAYEGRDHLTADDYLTMISLKTAALFSASAAIGAEVGGGGLAQIDALRRFGQELGMAFQIRDDILGLWGKTRTLGKPVGADLLRNKRSLPILHALSLDHPVRDRLRAALAGGMSRDEAAALSDELEAAGVRTHCEERARDYVARAEAALESVLLQEGPVEDLRALAAHLLERRA